MQWNKRWMTIMMIILVVLPLVACSESESASNNYSQPAYVESVEGAEFDRVVLTAAAATRLGVQTAVVREEIINGQQSLTIPYAAVIYGLQGETWAYTNPEPLTYVRAPITIDFIDDDIAVLSNGPPPGTEVAIVGVAELYGIETGVGK